jgi:hypothetical protein
MKGQARDRNADGNARLTGISASLVLPLVLFEVVTVVLGVKGMITAHVVVGLILVGPMLLKLGSVTYRLTSYYRGVIEYRRRGKPSRTLRLFSGCLALVVLLLLVSGLVLIVGPNSVHSQARGIHVVTAYLTVALLIGHLAAHLLQALRLASADQRPHASGVRGARARWLALTASLVAGGVLAILLGGRGSTYLQHYYPAHSVTAAPSARATALHLPARPGRPAIVDGATTFR